MILEVTENANTYTALGPDEERVVTDRFVLWMGRADEPHWNVAQRLRLGAGEVEDVRDEIHHHLRRRKRTACTWEVGSSATPSDLVDRLLALGLVDDAEPLAVGMALTGAPVGEPGSGVLVRRAASGEDELVAARIAAEAFGGPVLPRPYDPSSDVVTYLAYLDGEPVGRATGAFGEHGVSLFGGAVLEHARGRGVYRALVLARWEDGAARGTPAAFTQAGRRSRPILARLGFREICTIRILLDAFGRG